MIDQETAVKMGARFLLDRIDSYQMMPLNEDGTIDWESYEPGCTNWNILREMVIDEAKIADEQLEEDEVWIVDLVGLWEWSEDDYVASAFHFQVYVPKNADPDCDNDFEFERYE